MSCSIASQIAVMDLIQPMIASIRSHHHMEHPNYAMDLGEDEEEGNFNQARLT